ncbi:F protein [Perigonia lusca single nucleopolyhedrovirus]|uniref:F protein n=1 Tax=Perigonia lusca single nucleopolyhedrovirus TaxID=1675865 RepID=A0A0M3N210_9ABAC|nr:F protein [Perigonia lusca single nucleopolyhedrovirus]AKN80684.1 F protein [Perigonia lusca single nucleopolyhedrovirus]
MIVVKVSLTLLFSLTMAYALVHDASELVEIKPLPHTSGFFYQPINRMQFVEDIWHFIIEMDHAEIFYELDELYSETNNLMAYMKNHEEFANCSSSKVVKAEIDTFIVKRILGLVKKHNMIDSKIPKSGTYSTHEKLEIVTRNPFKHDEIGGGGVAIGGDKQRRKRSLFNFVGTVDKFLFGVMDSNDADELHRLAKTSNAINEQVKELTDKLITLSSYEEHKLCLEQQRNDLCVYVNAKVALILEQINEIDTLYTNLDRAVDDALNNKINSMVMTPERLFKEINDVNIHVPSKLSWPVPLKLENMHDLINHEIIKTHVFITQERKLLFILEIPLINEQTYDVYQVIPIPYCNNSKCAVIVPDSKYLGVSTNKRNYVRLEDDAPKICKISFKHLLCFAPKIIYDSSEASLCDIKILLKNEDDYASVDKDCDVRIGKFDSEIFYPIAEYNSWLYVLQKDTEISFDCINNDDNTAVAPLIIGAGVGTIYGKNVTKSCRMITKKVELSLHQLKNSMFSVSSVPISTSFNLSAAIRDLDQLEITSMKSNTDLDHKNLQGMTERLLDLRKQMDNNTVFVGSEIQTNNDASTESTFCWVMSWTPISCHAAQSLIVLVVSIVIFLVFYRIYKIVCPGLCTDVFDCCCSNNCCASQRHANSSVIRVSHRDNRIHFIDDPNKDRWNTVKYHKGNNGGGNDNVRIDYDDNKMSINDDLFK